MFRMTVEKSQCSSSFLSRIFSWSVWLSHCLLFFPLLETYHDTSCSNLKHRKKLCQKTSEGCERTLRTQTKLTIMQRDCETATGVPSVWLFRLFFFALQAFASSSRWRWCASPSSGWSTVTRPSGSSTTTPGRSPAHAPPSPCLFWVGWRCSSSPCLTCPGTPGRPAWTLSPTPWISRRTNTRRRIWSFVVVFLRLFSLQLLSL